MNHNIAFDQAFFSNRGPAWHKLGFVNPDPTNPMSAQDGASKIGMPSLRLDDLQTTGGMPIRMRAIIREATPADPVERFFGAVGPEYTLLDPLTIATIWDEVVSLPIETIGALGKGETTFFTTKLPSFDVDGKPYDNYLMVTSPYTGGAAIEVRETPICAVCQNTVIAAKAAATETFRVIHDQHVATRLAKWLVGLQDRAILRAEALKQTLDLFAAVQITSELEKVFYDRVYPLPTLPSDSVFLPEEERIRRKAAYEATLIERERMRSYVNALFQGAMTGGSQGKAIDLYNAVTEFECWRKSRNAQTQAVGSLFGWRAQTMESAYVTLELICKSTNPS